MPGRVVVQWDKEDCADLGIIKVDLLGLGMMAVLEDCLKLVRKHWREEIDLGQPPADDPPFIRPFRKATPSACSRWKAAPRWRRCRA